MFKGQNLWMIYASSTSYVLRRKFQINSCAELITDEDGEVLYLVSTGTTQFLQNRELFLAQQDPTSLC